MNDMEAAALAQKLALEFRQSIGAASAAHQETSSQQGVTIVITAAALAICPDILATYGLTTRAQRVMADAVRESFRRTMAAIAAGVGTKEPSGRPN